MNIDLAEKFRYAIPFTDKDGLLELAPKQKFDFAKWCRPEELYSEPKIVIGHHVDYYSIKQTVSNIYLKKYAIFNNLNIFFR